MDKINFSKTLRELRHEKGWTQKQLAEKVGVAHVSICDWEIRERRPGYEMLYELAKVFDVTIGQLLGVEEY